MNFEREIDAQVKNFEIRFSLEKIVFGKKLFYDDFEKNSQLSNPKAFRPGVFHKIVRKMIYSHSNSSF